MERLDHPYGRPDKFYHERLMDLIAGHTHFDAVLHLLNYTTYQGDPTPMLRDLLRRTRQKSFLWDHFLTAVDAHRDEKSLMDLLVAARATKGVHIRDLRPHLNTVTWFGLQASMDKAALVRPLLADA